MKRTNKIFLFIVLFIVAFSGFVLAENAEYVVKRELVFKNEKKYELTAGFAEIYIGNFNFTEYQDDISLKITPNPDEIREDDFGNKYAYYSLAGMQPNAELKVIIEREVMPKAINPDVSVRSNATVTKDLEIYVEPQERIESDNSKIVAKARELTEDISSDYKKALAIFEFVNTELQYDTSSSYANKGAVSALQNKRGVCEEFASLYVALCRAVDIPSRVVEGYKIDKNDVENEYGEYVTEYSVINHAWAEIYFDDYGWLPVEPTIIYMVGNERVPYVNAFCKLELAEYIPTGIYNYEKANRTMQYVTETSYEETIAVVDESKTEMKFEDIEEEYEWARENIENLYKIGIVNGYSDTEYAPEKNISRIEFICMLSRTLKYMNQSNAKDCLVYYHMDYDQEHWSKEDYDFLMKCYQAITPSDMVSAGYYNLAGVFGSSINMDKAITRAEVVALMDAFLKKDTNINVFTDIDGNKFESSILKSYASGLITGYPDGTFKPNGEITRAEMAAVLDRYISQNTYVLVME